MTTAIHRMVDACREGRDPAVIARMNSGWAVMGQKQMLRGYSLLLPDPVVPHLNALPAAARDQFLKDLGTLGEAVLAATGALRINYAMFGNVEPALHAHVHPRYTNEQESLRTVHPWGYDWAAARGFDVTTDAPLRDAIREKLVALQASSDTTRSDGRIHHLDLTVRDLVASTAFYDRWLPRMGLQRIADCAEGPLWRGSQLELGLQRARTSTAHDRYAPGLHHLAFAADSREAVIELHESMRTSGVNILDAPAEYPNYAPGYFALFFADPDGLKLEYVFTP
jgi:catechol 2,3-dioxygenase-like lactoylglutathione lyase family enzyme/diadenosine tetraphosphate (Ap4A) HIT family hydrolase